MVVCYAQGAPLAQFSRCRSGDLIDRRRSAGEPERLGEIESVVGLPAALALALVARTSCVSSLQLDFTGNLSHSHSPVKNNTMTERPLPSLCGRREDAGSHSFLHRRVALSVSTARMTPCGRFWPTFRRQAPHPQANVHQKPKPLYVVFSGPVISLAGHSSVQSWSLAALAKSPCPSLPLLPTVTFAAYLTPYPS